MGVGSCAISGLRTRRLSRVAVARVTGGVKGKWQVGLFLGLIALVVILTGRGADPATSGADGTPVGQQGLLGASLGFDAPGSGQTRPAGAAGSSRATDPTTSGGGLPAGGSSGELTANGMRLLPVAESAGLGGTLTRYAGASVTARHVFVVSAPVNKGFWLGSSISDRVYVELIGHGLVYPHPIRASDRVSFRSDGHQHRRVPPIDWPNAGRRCRAARRAGSAHRHPDEPGHLRLIGTSVPCPPVIRFRYGQPARDTDTTEGRAHCLQNERFRRLSLVRVGQVAAEGAGGVAGWRTAHTAAAATVAMGQSITPATAAAARPA